MHNIFNKFSFMLAFLVFIVFWNMLFGKKTTEALLWLILLGMALTNSNRISNLLKKGVTTVKSGMDENNVMNTPQYGGTPRQYA